MLNIWKLMPEIARLILVGAVVFLVMSLMPKSDDSAVLNEARAIRAQITAVIALNDSLRDSVDARNVRVAQLEIANADLKKTVKDLNARKPDLKPVVTWTSSVDSLKKVHANDSVALARTVIPIQDTIIKRLTEYAANRDTTVTTLQASNDNLEAQNADLKLNVKDLTFANDTLVTSLGSANKTIVNLEGTLKKKDKLFGIIPLPSRLQTAAITAVVTAIAVSSVK